METFIRIQYKIIKFRRLGLNVSKLLSNTVLTLSIAVNKIVSMSLSISVEEEKDFGSNILAI
jgi:hypothetical protein